jgi:CDP-diacylglycerol--glycerol-3-phosphate 3-phosphatidyltransferase
MVTPNCITKLRLILTFLGISLLLFSSSFWARMTAFWILLAASLSDVLDGWLARRWKQVTDTGKILDPIADKLFVLGVMSVFSFLKLYSIVWVILIALREISVTAVRFYYLKTGKVIAAETMGKAKAVSQNVSLLISYFYLFTRDHFSHWSHWPSAVTEALHFMNHFFLLIALILTLVSGFTFFVQLQKNRP